MVLGLFNDKSGADEGNPEQDVVAQLALQDMTISQIASFADDPFKLLHLNIDDPNFSPNDKHLILVNSGNDTALQDYMQTMDANSGRSSNNNNTTARLGDAMVSGVDRSTADERLSQDTSFTAKNDSMERRLENHHLNDESQRPEIFPDEQSLAIAETQVIDELKDAGVPQNLLDEASYGANGMEDRLVAYEQLANDDDLKGYINEMQGAASGEESVEVAQVQNEIKPPENNLDQGPQGPSFGMGKMVS